jgi:hypothetical protein
LLSLFEIEKLCIIKSLKKEMEDKTYTAADLARYSEIYTEVVEETYWELNVTNGITHPNAQQYEDLQQYALEELNNSSP